MRTKEEFLEKILKWPEQGGFSYKDLAEVLAEFEARLTKLEAAAPEAPAAGGRNHGRI